MYFTGDRSLGRGSYVFCEGSWPLERGSYVLYEGSWPPERGSYVFVFHLKKALFRLWGAPRLWGLLQLRLVGIILHSSAILPFIVLVLLPVSQPTPRRRRRRGRGTRGKGQCKGAPGLKQSPEALGDCFRTGSDKENP